MTYLTSNISITQTTFLYLRETNTVLIIYQRSTNVIHGETLKVLTGNTTVHSNSYCIVYGVSYDLWKHIPVQNSGETGNSGYDAFWRKKWLQNIRANYSNPLKISMNQTVELPKAQISLKSSSDCPSKGTSSSTILDRYFLHNGTFMLGLIPSTAISCMFLFNNANKMCKETKVIRLGNFLLVSAIISDS
ncbi:unnamed protein product [Adineta steineri]|uniref:Uncharacterized protein n=1 Tax=Adineta steineri TaxID=433720 RepID=A0A816DCG7_9BILA|nr:unnamed protein product [Adineta steineri]CAF1631266.1 unnamed protein product [Adineta steineri]